jgi:hypothetical protein
MRLFFLACPTTLKLGRLYALCLWLKETPRRMPLLSLTQNTTVLSLAKRSNHTSTETKAEQLDGIVIRHAAHTASRNDNERLLYYWSKPLQQYLIHTIKTNGSFLLFYIVAMLIKPKEIVKRRT